MTIAVREGCAEVYEFRKSGWDWATIIIYPKPNYHMVAIHSSFGGFVYAWADPGPSIYRFLAQIDIGYSLCKFVSGDSEFDPEETAKRLRKDILSRRRSRDCTQKQAQNEWDLTFELEDGDVDFRAWLDKTELFEDDYEMACYKPGPRSRDFMAFYLMFWAELAKVLLAKADGIKGEI